ncbi:MAG: efflux transporter outer membrane subunit [Gallionella sp.]|nr:efflux transporter outer membrane subunit [Gallionella sp.]
MRSIKTFTAHLIAQRDGTVLAPYVIRSRKPLFAGICMLLSACAVGPDYKRPALETPVQFKENKGWVQAAPLAVSARGAWWTVFADATLNSLEPRVTQANQSLRASYYAYQQALALTDMARAAEFPTLGASVSSTRSSSGGGTATGIGATGATPIITGKTFGFGASWAPDFWGKVRRQVEADEASALASLDNLLAAQLSLQTTLAQDYFQIRQIDSQIALAQSTVSAYEKFLQLTQNRYAAGVATTADVALAQSQLANARVQLAAFNVQRPQLEHAIAVLIGEAPANFSLPAMPSLPQPRAIPAGLPSQLLLRRPDLGASERQVAAANAQIGVAVSAFFPALTLSAQRGWRSSTFANLVSAPNAFWSVGPSLAETLFDAGARSALVAQNRNAYQQAVAQYRQLGLQALQQVEDQLAALAALADESQLQLQAEAAADESLRLATNQYKAGIVTYLNVITAQTNSYTAHNATLQIAGQQLTANVALIQALGGGWGDDEQPALGASVVAEQSDTKEN